MKRFLSITIFTVLCTVHVNAQHAMGPRLMGMANSGAAISDNWSSTANIAGITASQTTSIAIGYQKYFNGQAWSDQNLRAVLPLKNNFIGLSFQNYGIAEYKELTTGIAYAKQFGDQLAIGIKANYHQISIQDYGSIASFSLDVGVIHQLSDQITLGTYVQNIANQQYNTLNLNANIPLIAAIGLAYQSSDKVLITCNYNYKFKNSSSVSVGTEYQLLEKFMLRGGLKLLPFNQFAGIGFKHKKIALDMAVQKDPNIGYSSSLAIAYAF